jgi:hypothetical protein
MLRSPSCIFDLVPIPSTALQEISRNMRMSSEMSAIECGSVECRGPELLTGYTQWRSV